MTSHHVRDSNKVARIAAADREAELDEIVPIVGEASSEEDAAQKAQKVPLPPSLYEPADYFPLRGFMDPTVKEHRVIVDWYIRACHMLYQGVNEAQIYEGEPDHFINFKASYVGHCRAHGIDPEQPLTWEALYRCLRLTGHREFPLLSTFMNATSTSAVLVNKE